MSNAKNKSTIVYITDSYTHETRENCVQTIVSKILEMRNQISLLNCSN